MIVIPLFILAMIETIAPRLMKLPFHHCLYCLWQYVPDSILIFLFFAIVIFAPVWALLLEKIKKKWNKWNIFRLVISSLTSVILIIILLKI